MTKTLTQNNQPDILEVIADLSNEEVFTPPRVVNKVLDLLPSNVWADPSLTFLDPGSKTGVFLREITRRLFRGLSTSIEDEKVRLEHILEKMVWGIATTELTSLMSRRTLYCSKDANGEHSIVRMDSSAGHIWYEPLDHRFSGGKCIDCGSSSSIQREGRDNYAYGFIHQEGIAKIEKEFPVKFDVIVGNPPYQMDMGETSDIPLYDKFVTQAIALNPQYVSMIIPSRWMAGGKGLDDFRAKMLSDRRITNLVDFPNAVDVFPGVEIQSGVCYFLWDAEHNGDCDVTLIRGEEKIGPVARDLGEFDVFIRDSRATSVLHKVLARAEPGMSEIVSGQTPFGLTSNFKGYRHGDKQSGDLKLYLIESQKRVERWISPSQVTKNPKLISAWKVYVPEAYNGGTNLPHRVVGPSFVGEPQSICSQSYLAIGPLKSESQANSLQSYVNTRFFRFILSLRKISQHAGKSTYGWVPQQSWDQDWTDSLLYAKYGITPSEQQYIESMVKEIAE
jgi:site-specific DNA-methyltransferase (adenine-specific)